MEKTKCPGCGSMEAILEYDDHPYGESFAREIHGISCECGDFPYCYRCRTFDRFPDGHDDAKHAAILAAERLDGINQGYISPPNVFEVIEADILCPPG